MYVRQANDQTFDFIVSGKLWRDAMVMQDKETGSLWSQITGVAFQGELTGTGLETYPFDLVSWKDWVANYPDTKVLKKEVQEPQATSHYDNYFADPDKIGIFGRQISDARLAPKDLVVAVDMPSGTKVFPIDDLPSGEVVNTTVGDVPVALFPTPAGGFRAYSRKVGGKTLEFGLMEGHIVAGDSELKWILDSGQAVDSEAKSLQSLRAHITYWMGWVSFFPDAEIWEAAGE